MTGILHNIRLISLHPRFTSGNPAYDVAVVMLTQDIESSFTVKLRPNHLVYFDRTPVKMVGRSSHQDLDLEATFGFGVNCDRTAEPELFCAFFPTTKTACSVTIGAGVFDEEMMLAGVVVEGFKECTAISEYWAQVIRIPHLIDWIEEMKLK